MDLGVPRSSRGGGTKIQWLKKTARQQSAITGRCYIDASRPRLGASVILSALPARPRRPLLAGLEASAGRGHSCRGRAGGFRPRHEGTVSGAAGRAHVDDQAGPGRSRAGQAVCAGSVEMRPCGVPRPVAGALQTCPCCLFKVVAKSGATGGGLSNRCLGFLDRLCGLWCKADGSSGGICHLIGFPVAPVPRLRVQRLVYRHAPRYGDGFLRWRQIGAKPRSRP